MDNQDLIFFTVPLWLSKVLTEQTYKLWYLSLQCFPASRQSNKAKQMCFCLLDSTFGSTFPMHWRPSNIPPCVSANGQFPLFLIWVFLPFLLLFESAAFLSLLYHHNISKANVSVCYYCRVFSIPQIYIKFGTNPHTPIYIIIVCSKKCLDWLTLC